MEITTIKTSLKEVQTQIPEEIRIGEKKMTKKQHKKCAETYYNRGLAHSKKGELELAIKDYTKAIELKPDYAEAYYYRAGAFLRLGNREKAKSDIATARKMGLSIIVASDKIKQDYDRAWKTLGNI